MVVAGKWKVRYTDLVRSVTGFPLFPKRNPPERVAFVECIAWAIEPETRDNHAETEDTLGRGQALREDWQRQNHAPPDEDAPHPHVQAAEDQSEVGQDAAGLRRRLRKSRADDPLRLSRSAAGDGRRHGPANALHGPLV